MKQVVAFAQITNVVKSTRRVKGVLTLEIKDKTHGWVMDYDESKPYFEEWSTEIHNATQGKSYGNLRLMHSLENIGKVSNSLEYDDANKKIYCEAEVSDDKAWEKVLNGELCGFSWSGNKVLPVPTRVKEKWAGLPDGSRRYIGKPAELSLVDNPNQPGAYFEIVNAAGQPVFTVEDENGEKTEHAFVMNTSMYDFVNLVQSIQDLQYTWVDAELEKEFKLALSKLTTIAAKMAKGIAADFKEEAAETTTIAENAATGENDEMFTKEQQDEINAAITNALSGDAVTNAVVASPAFATTITNAIGAIDFAKILEPVVNAAVAPLKAEITAIKDTTPAPTPVVTREVAPETETATFVANAVEGVTDEDAKMLNQLHKMQLKAN